MSWSSLYPTRWMARRLPYGLSPTAALQDEAPATTGTTEARQRTARVSTAVPARDCRLGDGRAAVMQVRPLSVVSGTAGSSPFGRSPFGTSGWL